MKREIDVGDDPKYCNRKCLALQSFPGDNPKYESFGKTEYYCYLDGGYVGWNRLEKTNCCKKEAK